MLTGARVFFFSSFSFVVIGSRSGVPATFPTAATAAKERIIEQESSNFESNFKIRAGANSSSSQSGPNGSSANQFKKAEMKPEYHSRAFIINLSCNYMLLMLFSFCAICRLLIKLPLIRLQVYFSFICNWRCFFFFSLIITYFQFLNYFCRGVAVLLRVRKMAPFPSFRILHQPQNFPSQWAVWQWLGKFDCFKMRYYIAPGHTWA